MTDSHDCTAAGCEGAAMRAHREAIRQGLPAYIEPNGEPLHDAAVDAGYRTLARVLASATSDPSSVVRRDAAAGSELGAAETSPHATDAHRAGGAPTAARAPDGASPRRSNRAPEAPARTAPTDKTKARPVRRAPSNSSGRSRTKPAGHAGTKER